MSALHVSLDVSNLEKSLAFYASLFGKPVKQKPDYVKFVGSSPESFEIQMPPRHRASQILDRTNFLTAETERAQL